MDDLKTERSFDSQATWIINVLGLFFDMLPIGVCTTGHLQTSGRLVQELNICTVDVSSGTNTRYWEIRVKLKGLYAIGHRSEVIDD